MKCRSCGYQISEFFNLGPMPLVNSFLKEKDLKREKKYKLATAFCKHCYLVQLTNTVSPEVLFRNYIYFSSTSSSFLEHNRKTATYLSKRLKLTKKSLVVEIASNDGAMLQYFKKLGIRILGIDPATNIAKVANARGIKTLPEFFNFSLSQKLQKKGISADLIYGANVLAHVPQIVDFAKGVKTLLADQGTAIFEFPYMKGLLENKFDTIYHEHVFYYSLIALQNLFKRVNLEIYDVELVSVQGGSLRIYISHPGVFKITNTIHNLVKSELSARFGKLTTYKKMGQRVAQLKKDILVLLKKLKKQGLHIGAYSAPAKGLILLNYFGIGKNYLDFIVDKSKAKQGLYTPGVHMKVYSPEEIYKQKPDYLLILCWNIASEVMTEHKKFQKRGGKFIIPIPKIKII